MENAWNKADVSARGSIEIKLQCCGFRKVSDDPSCRISTTQPCAPLLANIQQETFNFLSSCCLVSLIVTLFSTLMSGYLSNKYKKRQMQMLGERPQPLRDLRLKTPQSPPPTNSFAGGNNYEGGNNSSNNVPIKSRDLSSRAPV